MANMFNFCTMKLLLIQKSGSFDTFGAAFIMWYYSFSLVIIVVDGIQWNPSIAEMYVLKKAII